MREMSVNDFEGWAESNSGVSGTRGRRFSHQPLGGGLYRLNVHRLGILIDWVLTSRAADSGVLARGCVVFCPFSAKDSGHGASIGYHSEHTCHRLIRSLEM